MARYYYLREGNEADRLKIGPNVEIDSVIDLMGRHLNTEAKWRCKDCQDLPTMPSERENLNQFRDFNYVFVQIEPNELKGPFDKPGCYFLTDLRPADTFK